MFLKGLAGNRQGPALGTSQRKLLTLGAPCGHQFQQWKMLLLLPLP